MSEAALTMLDLRVDLGAGDSRVHALRGVDLELPPGRVSGLVGESGSGKSTAMLAAIGLLPHTGRVTGGSILLGDKELTQLPERQWREVRGRRIGVIFQNARAALHPMRTVETQLARVHRRHLGSSRREAAAAVLEVLASVGFEQPSEIAGRFAHQLSGGQCQRAMIGLALIAQPDVVLADEPTSGLDVTVQEQVLETLLDRVRETRTTLLLISHDISVVDHACDYVNVMYAGEIVEAGTRVAVLGQPAHPYTQGLLESLDPEARRMPFVAGVVPDLRYEITGCAFADRCPKVSPASRARRPEPVTGPGGQQVRCVLYAGPGDSSPDEAGA